MPQQNAVYDGLAVYGIAEGVGQFRIVFEQIVVEIIQNATVIGSFHIVNGEICIGFKFFGVLRGNLRQIYFAAFQLQSTGFFIRNNFKDDGIDGGRFAVIILIFLQRDALPHIPMRQFIRAGAHGVLIERIGNEVFALQKMAGQDADGQIIQHGNVGGGQSEGEGMLIHRGHGNDVFIIGSDFRFVFRV